MLTVLSQKHNSHKRAVRINKTIRFLVILLAVFAAQTFVGLNTLDAYAENTQNGAEEIYRAVDEQLDNLDLSDMDEYLQTVSDNRIFGGGIRNFMTKLIKGEFDNTTQTFLSFALDAFTNGLKNSFASLSIVLVVSILLGIISQTRKSFSVGTTDIVFLSCYCVIITSVLTGVWKLTDLTERTLYDVRSIISIFLPVLLTVMSAMGSVVSAQVFQPSVALLAGGVIEFVTVAIVPVCVLGIVMSVISNLSNNVRLNKLSYFFNKLSTTMLVIVFTVFTSTMTIQGISAASADKISVRAAKFAARSYVPIIGNFLSEGFDFILAATELIKNSLGLVTLAVILITVLSPVLTILLYSLALNLLAAVIEPIADARIVTFLSSISKNLTVLYVSLIAVAFMLVIILMLAICATNVM